MQQGGGQLPQVAADGTVTMVSSSDLGSRGIRLSRVERGCTK